MFGRRKSTIPKGRVKPAVTPPSAPVTKQTPVRGPSRPAHFSQHVLPIIVRQEEYDRGGADLVNGLVNYVNLMMEDGLYDPTQIPAHAMQSYHTDLYLAQVNNGGHSQFIGNLMGPYFDDTIRNIHKAFQGIGAQPYIQIFAEFLNWMKQNPRLVEQQSGFGDIPAALNDLDTRFYALSKTHNLSNLNAKWIESWTDLRVVSTGSYQTEMQKLFESNPQKAGNSRVRAIRIIEQDLWSSSKAKLNYVGLKSASHILVTHVHIGGDQLIEGRSVPVFPIETSAGRLLGVFSDHWIGIYRAVQGDKPRSIHIVMNAEMETVGALISKYKAATALHLVFEKWNQKNDVIAMTPNLNQHGQLAVVLTTKRAELFVVAFGDQGVRFYDPGMNLISTFSRQQILTHSAASL